MTAADRLPLVVGELHAPAGRRTLHVLVVRHCPGCAHLHLHRVGDPSRIGYLRVGSCGVTYRVDVAPALAVAA